jgi:hypothetical protein
MEVVVEGNRVAIFDFEFDVPGDAEDKMWNQTVLAMKSVELDCPHFAMHPVTFWSKCLSRFLAVVKSHPSLPEGYGFVGEGERVLEVVAPRLHALLADQVSIEVGESFMLVYKLNKLVEPDDMEAFMNVGLKVHRQLLSAKLNQS